jgi:E3 ubiquitin-protein ligase FANCL
MFVESGGTFLGWVEVQCQGNASAMYSWSVKSLAGEGQPNLVDCQSLSMDEDLRTILEPIREKSFFRNKLSGKKEVRALSRDLQSLVNELQSDNDTKNDSSAVEHGAGPLSAAPLPLPTYLLASDRGFSSLLLSHITDIGWEHIEKTTEDMSQLTLSVRDSRQRKHSFEVYFDRTSLRGYGYPWTPPKIMAELPVSVQLQPTWPTHSGEGGSLYLVLAAVVAEAERHADLFDILQDIDTHCCVLEPVHPSFAVTTRRIALERSCSMYIDFPDPRGNPYALCNIRFLGPPDKLGGYQQLLQRNAHMWQTTSAGATSRGSMVRENLQRVLGLTLPERRLRASTQQEGARAHGRSKRTRQAGGAVDSGQEGCEGSLSNDNDHDHEHEFITECGICYSYEREMPVASDRDRSTTNLPSSGGSGSGGSGGTLPEQVCPNAKCGKMFHASCLLEWLQAVPSSRMSFGTVFGSCPYCHEWLSVHA